MMEIIIPIIIITSFFLSCVFVFLSAHPNRRCVDCTSRFRRSVNILALLYPNNSHTQYYSLYIYCINVTGILLLRWVIRIHIPLDQIHAMELVDLARKFNPHRMLDLLLCI
jgi:hypothetical protein